MTKETEAGGLNRKDFENAVIVEVPQEETKSESELREEWLEATILANKFTYFSKHTGSRELEPEAIADWWLSQRQKDRERLVEIVRGLREKPVVTPHHNPYISGHNDCLTDLEQVIINNFK